MQRSPMLALIADRIGGAALTAAPPGLISRSMFRKISLGRGREFVRRTGEVAACALLLHGCASVVPKDGPTGAEVRGAAEVRLEDSGRLSYAFVKLSPLVLQTFQTDAQPTPAFSGLARVGAAAEVRISASDTVSVTIFEAASGGLFVPPEAGSRPGNFVQIPAQELDRSGNISVPYGGSVRALGRTPREIEADIIAKLRDRAIEPQVIVTVGDRTAGNASSTAVSVLGDVATPTAIPLRPGGIRLLGAIARAGGSRNPPHSSLVTVQRRGKTESALLLSIIKDPRQNIQLAPEDVVVITFEPRIFMAFGATGNIGTQTTIGTFTSTSTNTAYSRRFTIDRDNMSLTEALAAAGGPVGDRSDPHAVFLFRYMPAATLQRAGVDISNFPGPQVPTVLTVDLAQAEGYFLANHLWMKHNDIIYVSDAPSVDLLKFLNIVSGITSTARSGIGVVSDVQNLWKP
jgi:polysaccharide export outer membrane protein